MVSRTRQPRIRAPLNGSCFDGTAFSLLCCRGAAAPETTAPTSTPCRIRVIAETPRVGISRRFRTLETLETFTRFTASEWADLFVLMRLAIQSGEGVLKLEYAKVCDTLSRRAC